MTVPNKRSAAFAKSRRHGPQIARAVRRFADRCLSKADVARADRPQSPPRSAIFDIYVSPVTARLSVNNPAVEVSGSGSRRRVVVSDPQAIRSITLNLAADGYEDRQEELATQPGSTSSFRLSLQRSQPNGFGSPAADNETKAQTPGSTKSGFQVATAKSIEPKPKPQDLSHDTDAPATEAPDSFDGDRPGKVRMNNGLKTMLVWIPPGHFTMGTPPEEGKRKDEGPVEVTLTQGFWLGKYEVTQSEWHSVMHTTPWHGQLYVQEAENDAVSYVNWEEATAFCARLHKARARSGAFAGELEIRLTDGGAVGIRLPGRNINAVSISAKRSHNWRSTRGSQRVPVFVTRNTPIESVG